MATFGPTLDQPEILQPKIRGGSVISAVLVKCLAKDLKLDSASMDDLTLKKLTVTESMTSKSANIDTFASRDALIEELAVSGNIDTESLVVDDNITAHEIDATVIRTSTITNTKILQVDELAAATTTLAGSGYIRNTNPMHVSSSSTSGMEAISSEEAKSYADAAAGQTTSDLADLRIEFDAYKAATDARIAQNESDIATLQFDLNTANAVLTALSSRVSILEGRTDDLTTDVGDLTVRVDNLDVIAANLDASVINHGNQIAQLNTDVLDLDGRVKFLENMNPYLSDSVNLLWNQVGRYSSKAEFVNNVGYGQSVNKLNATIANTLAQPHYSLITVNLGVTGFMGLIENTAQFLGRKHTTLFKVAFVHCRGCVTQFCFLKGTFKFYVDNLGPESLTVTPTLMGQVMTSGITQSAVTYYTWPDVTIASRTGTWITIDTPNNLTYWMEMGSGSVILFSLRGNNHMPALTFTPKNQTCGPIAIMNYIPNSPSYHTLYVDDVGNYATTGSGITVTQWNTSGAGTVGRHLLFQLSTTSQVFFTRPFVNLMFRAENLVYDSYGYVQWVVNIYVRDTLGERSVCYRHPNQHMVVDDVMTVPLMLYHEQITDLPLTTSPTVEVDFTIGDAPDWIAMYPQQTLVVRP